jgi:hypothetical protein
VRALKLLELQRHAMLMYTSCGWFFDDLSGIETVQVIQYAGRALQLGQELFGNGLESDFLSQLERAKSNLPEHRDGRLIYRKFVKPAMVDLEKVGAHYAISSLFEDYPPKEHNLLLRGDREEVRKVREGKPIWPWDGSKITSASPNRQRSVSARCTWAIKTSAAA